MGKKITDFLFSHWSELLIGLLAFSYIVYFSWFTVLRYRTLYASYFDLGIMHQTVYNTFVSLKTGDFSRFLEMTNPHGIDQVKRMAVHNDPLLALLAPFYFIYAGPETLLVIQSVFLGLGGIVMYAIGRLVFRKAPYEHLISFFFAFSYLLYPPLQFTNHFDFHAVALATLFLLLVFYFFLKKKYGLSMVFVVLSLLSKEEVGLTLCFFGLFSLIQLFQTRKEERKRLLIYGVTVTLMSVLWFALSMKVIIPYFNKGSHFAMEYFGDFGDSSSAVFIGLFKNPSLVLKYIFRVDTYQYLLNVLGPVGFLSFLSPLHLFIAAPEFGINLLSNSGAMRNIYYHYTAVITPFVFISALYGFKNIVSFFKNGKKFSWFIIAIITICPLYYSFNFSPLPFSGKREVHPFLWPVKERFDAFVWQQKLKDDSLKVMSTGHMAPIFASRKYFYNFSPRYDLADYVVVSVDEVYNSYDSDELKPIYEKLVKDTSLVRIYKNDTFEVYKKV